MSNDFLKELLSLHPELADEYNSEQYELSLEIIDLVTKIGKDSKKMAKILGYSHNKYLRLESGDTSIPVSEYKEVIEKMKAYKEQSAAYDEQLATEYSFIILSTLKYTPLKDTAKMELVKMYSNTKQIHSRENTIPSIKSYLLYLDNSIELIHKKVNHRFWTKQYDHYPEESSSSYFDFTYQY